MEKGVEVLVMRFVGWFVVSSFFCIFFTATAASAHAQYDCLYDNRPWPGAPGRALLAIATPATQSPMVVHFWNWLRNPYVFDLYGLNRLREPVWVQLPSASAPGWTVSYYLVAPGFPVNFFVCASTYSSVSYPYGGRSTFGYSAFSQSRGAFLW